MLLDVKGDKVEAKKRERRYETVLMLDTIKRKPGWILGPLWILGRA